ncbi:hypothetical protein [Streptomyces sp. W1SF4]|uniref:hypothetical protein n=1 Tax=Streptomyces sp. W1SF4 TaxID=2305220 RepID=UPI000F6DAD9C|nr:hypothetical protein [Streptomyces sp. W1SF4]AZM92493.1 hypothetical protein D1J60_31880 [Streptomyces sp. W1SF4]
MTSTLARRAAAFALAFVPLSLPATTHAAPTAQLAQRIVLTNSDDGRTLVANPGDEIEVRLTGYRENGLTWTWSTPTSGDSTVFRRTAGRTAPNGDASAAFQAEQDGAATITAQRSCRPDAGRVCPSVITPWKVTVEAK